MTSDFENLVPHRAFDIIEFKQSGCYQASAGQTGALRPAKPVAHQRAQARQTFGSLFAGSATRSFARRAILSGKCTWTSSPERNCANSPLFDLPVWPARTPNVTPPRPDWLIRARP